MAPSTTVDPRTTWQDLGFTDETLQRNVEALRQRDASLAQRLDLAGIHAGLQIVHDDDGAPRVARELGRARCRVEETPDEIVSVVALRSTLLIGLGTGERADVLLRTLPPEAVLYVHERDAGLATLALARHDWRDEIVSGRLVVLLGADLHAQAIPDQVDVVHHPLLVTGSDRVAARVARTKTPSTPASRAAVLRGELLQEEIADALERRDRDVMILERGTTSVVGLAGELARLDAPLAMSINFEPELAEICGRLGVDYAAWEIDPTASALPRADACAAEYTHVFTWRARRVAEFEAAGWRNAEHLAIGADPVRRQPTEDDPVDALVFVGSCMLSQGRLHADLLHRAIAGDRPRAAAWSSFLDAIDRLERDVVRDPCRRDIPEVLAAELESRGLPTFLPIEGDEVDVRVLAGERLASSKRIAVARALEADGLEVYGESDWEAALSPDVYAGPAGHGEQLTRLLSTAAVSVDINRIYQPDIVTLRVFETGACGGFVLTEESDALRDVFAFDEIATWSSLEELRELAAHYRAHPDERDAMAARLHARVLREHTVSHRVDHMIEVVERRRRRRDVR